VQVTQAWRASHRSSRPLTPAAARPVGATSHRLPQRIERAEAYHRDLMARRTRGAAQRFATETVST